MWCSVPGRAGLLALGLLLSLSPGCCWDADLELFDLVEEMPYTFYDFLSVEQDASSAEIKTAYRRLSLLLHPDKNKDEDAENQFRQLVAINEVLKDEERRRRYDDILENGLPDWRQPVFYYRRGRKISNAEVGFLLFIILTVGHYAVIWSIYLEKQRDKRLMEKEREEEKKEKREKEKEKKKEKEEKKKEKKKEKEKEKEEKKKEKKKEKEKEKETEEKKKQGSRPPEDRTYRVTVTSSHSRSHYRPNWQDILPLKLSIWLYLSIKNLPQTVQEVKQYYEEYQQMKQQQREEAEGKKKPKVEKPKVEKPKVKKPKVEKPKVEKPKVEKPKVEKPKVKKPKVEFPVYEPVAESPQSYDQTTSIEEIEDQMDDWLQERKGGKKKVTEWTEDELSLLSRLMVKFPGGTPGRWEKIAQELGRAVTDVTTKVKQLKDNLSHSTGLVKLSDLKGSGLPVKSLPVADSMVTQREGGACAEVDEEEESGAGVRRRSKKTSEGKAKVRGRRQKDFDPTALEDEEEGPQEPAIWTQNQQKLLELARQQFPRGTAERWDRIAKVIPGKTKEECMIRYKMLAELVQKRKNAKS